MRNRSQNNFDASKGGRSFAKQMAEGIPELHSGGGGDRGHITPNASNQELLGSICNIGNQRHEAIPAVANRVIHHDAHFGSCLEWFGYNAEVLVEQPICKYATCPCVRMDELWYWDKRNK
jgi:hypothetical protein